MSKIRLLKLVLLTLMIGIVLICYGGSCDSTSVSSGSSVSSKPSLIINPATDITIDSATLNCVVNPNGINTIVHFQWGRNINWKNNTDSQPIGDGRNDINVSAAISGLLAETVYHFRVAATASTGTFYGAKQSFSTLVPVNPPAQVTHTNPADGATNVSINTQLSWVPASGASSYDVYFGTAETLLEYKTSTTNTNYNIGALSFITTYYWRIDSMNRVGITAGIVRSFTTKVAVFPVQVTCPQPPDRAEKLSVYTQLSWASDSEASSYDVYFGTSNPPPYKTNTDNTNYNPGRLSLTTKYYWRIDSRNDDGATTGNVWSFTTLTGWVQVDVGLNHTIGLKSDGTLWAWGLNDNGQLGDGTTVSKNVPTHIDTNTNWSSIAVIWGNHTVALKTDGTLWAWGKNDYGQLGDGTIISKTVPTRIGSGTDWSKITVGSDHTIALKSDGTLWAWGKNDYGQLGDGTIINNTVPIRIGIDTNWSKIVAGGEHTIALKRDGTLWAWGRNDSGQLGDGTIISKNVPTLISNDTKWSNIIAGGLYTVALKTDGTLWSWGVNNVGQLGLGNTTSPITIPTQVIDTNWSAIANGVGHTIGLKADGTLWTWGDNSSGQLGDGTIISKSVPIRIGTDTNWSSVIAGGQGYTIALKVDGILWAWGKNDCGQLGDGTTQNKSIPVQIGQ